MEVNTKKQQKATESLSTYKVQGTMADILQILIYAILTITDTWEFLSSFQMIAS